MARELFVIEEQAGLGPQSVGDAFLSRADAEVANRLNAERPPVVRYVPEDALALASTRLEALLRQKMPHEVWKQIASIRADLEVALR